jgi:hypothetical protein
MPSVGIMAAPRVADSQAVDSAMPSSAPICA